MGSSSSSWAAWVGCGQVKAEVLDCLDFMKFVYGVLGMTYRLELSTKPEKALGDDALWAIAESVSTLLLYNPTLQKLVCPG